MTAPTQPAIFDLPASRQPYKSLAEQPLREWPIGERPVERLYAAGPAALSDVELLAVLFSSGGGTHPVALAQQLIVAFGGWHGLMRATIEELGRVPGLNRSRAAQIKATLEIARRTLLADPGQRLQIKSPGDAAQILMLEMAQLDQEELRTILLDTKNRIQRVVTVYRGSLNTSMVRVGEVFKEAIRHNSAALIVAHNHPSGDPTPSPEDVLVTRQIVDAGKLMDVEVLDHLVIGHSRYVSLREKGLGFAG